MGWSNKGWASDQGGWSKPSVSLSPPTARYESSSSTTTFPTGSTTSTTGLTTGAGFATRFLIAVIGASDGINATATAVTFTPSGFSPVNATVVQSGSGSSPNGDAVIAYAVVPDGTSFSVDIAWSDSLFSTPDMSLYSADSALMLSQTPVTGAANNNSATASINVNTTTVAGGFMLTGASHATADGDTGILSGTESYTTDYDQFVHGHRLITGHVNGISSNVASNTLFTFSAAASNSAIVAVWR